jgi:hypothetical protein
VLKRTFVLKKDETAVGRRKLHNEELCNLHSSPNMIRMIKSKRMRDPGHVARIEEKRNAYRFWWERQKERDY